ncbi:MAG TPA: enoyl-CoA hydratase [Candidatus Melainabacteria bacterium]|jgi:enoyl-CoA hydratase/carnithine racemase|nr:enoyl-CoA hydratase [Candidatus Melainabacteria bacterium]HIN64973.1 enoyl-CoA hydratase [Candidatus Obscuribacterales bacterium]
MPVDERKRELQQGERSQCSEAVNSGEKSLDSENVLLVEREGDIAWFKLNRGKVMNCLNRPLLNALINACHEVAKDRSVRVVAIIGAGKKAFCAGADLAERKGMTQAETLDYLALIQKTMRTIETLPQPVIAAINGSAYGGGTELALSCDLRVMVEEAQLRLTEVKLGIIPGAGGTQRLPRLIGKSKAKEMILTGSPINAFEGQQFGLIHKVVTEKGPEDAEFNPALMETVREWVKEIATGAPLSLAAAKEAIDNGYDRDLEAGLALETKSYLTLLNTKDRLEGLAAFAEKRKPVYVGE